MLGAEPPSNCDLAIVICDGLSAPAAQRQAAPLLAHLLPLLQKASISVGLLCVVRNGRVAIEDQIGSTFRAKNSSQPDRRASRPRKPRQPRAYLVYDPRPGRTDAERNCVSNIRPEASRPSPPPKPFFT